ncbi:MAG: thiol peroxidase [Chromatiaceae bacterium]|nr:thiol peroxidase [Gammaproteobacteria bacterium]MCP5304817.1 thiol peroxidase [Chromatiaceae bacterium]MCP5314776.1 thiol peroxidase [Chromatiaceae bacterium]
MAQVTLHGSPFNTNGDLPAVGSTAPDFKLVDAALNDVSLADFAGKKKLISIVPSLDTPTCATSTKVFNQRLGSRSDVVVLVVSADLPFAQGRFCQAEGTADVKTLSMMRSRNFAKDYGILLVDGPLAGITARGALVLDADNKVVYAQLVGEIGDEPDYDAAIAALG